MFEDCTDYNKAEASTWETALCSDKLGNNYIFREDEHIPFSIYADGSVIEIAPMLFAIAWSLAIVPHVFDIYLDRTVPALRLALLLPLSSASFAPLVYVSFDFDDRGPTTFYFYNLTF